MQTAAPPLTTRRLHFEELLFLVGVGANLVVLLALDHFPYGDITNHLARYVLMDRFWFGDAPADIRVQLAATPYIGVDVFGMGLVHMFGPELAVRMLAAFTLTLVPVGMYSLICVTAPAQRGWALVAVLFGFSWFFVNGVLNYVIGLGLVFLWLSLWWPRRDTTSSRWRLVLGGTAAALYFVHLSAPLTILVVIWVDCVLEEYRYWRGTGRTRLVPSGSRAATVAAVTVPIACVWIWAGGGHEGGNEIVFRSITWKLAAFGSPMYSLSILHTITIAGAYGLSLVAFGYIHRHVLRIDSLVTASVVFLVLFLAFPNRIGASSAVDARWLLPAYLLPFCMSLTAGGHCRRQQRAALVFVLAACLTSAGMVWGTGRAIDRRLADFDRVLEQIPARSRVLPLVVDAGRGARVGPYPQYAFWHIIRKEGHVPGLWSFTGTRENSLSFPHFKHFAVLKLSYRPANDWGTADLAPLDWVRISSEYDYVVQAGDNGSVEAYLKAHSKERLRSGEIILFEVHPAHGRGTGERLYDGS